VRPEPANKWPNSMTYMIMMMIIIIIVIRIIIIVNIIVRMIFVTFTKHNQHNRQTSMPAPGFKPAIPSTKRPQTYALDRGATGTRFFTLKLSLQLG